MWAWRGNFGSALEASGNNRWSMAAGWSGIDRLSTEGRTGVNWRDYDHTGIATWCDGDLLVHKSIVIGWRAFLD